MKAVVYGPIIGNGSFARVARGMSGALQRAGMFGAMCPIDCEEDPEEFRSPSSDVAFFVGPLNMLSETLRGRHDRVFYLVSPNSSWLPKWVIDVSGSSFHGRRVMPFCPSDWAMGVVRSHGGNPVLFEHGIDDAFNRECRADGRPGGTGPVSMLHLTSTCGQRKGTVELIKAWKEFSEDVGECKLTIVAEVDAANKIFSEFDLPESVEVVTRMNFDAERMALFYTSFDAVVQPSRGEAFGMVPLEAAACGVPVIMTGATGHSQYFGHIAAKVHVKTGEDSPIDDGPSAMAPSLSAESVLESLYEFMASRRLLSTMAMHRSESVRTNWTWDRALESAERQWLK